MSQIEQNRNGKRRDYLNSYQLGFGGCWIYTGSINNRGYGTVLGRGAHRYFYTALVGAIPQGMQLDHLCRTRACVNPDHLEPVTQSENLRRANLFCRRGHRMDEANTYRYAGSRSSHSTCRTCKKEAKREARAKRREA